ncbi:MAG: FliM/FliN family flagellar motor switch protein [bacterium]
MSAPRAEIAASAADAGAQEAAPADLKPFLDIPLRVQIELGRSSIRLRELLNLEPGAVIELRKMTGEHADVVVGDVAVARAEMIVSDEFLVARIAQILKEPGSFA